MKFEIQTAAMGVLVFAGMQRMIEIITNYFIKPNIPKHIDPQERDAIRLIIEIIVISVFLIIIKKFC